MKAINIAKTILAAFAASLFCACDQVDVEDRYIPMPPVEAKRVVLLEEYTGQKCVNCPTAHKTIADLQQQYGDNLISVSIHCGGDVFSFNASQFPFGLATDLTQALGDAAGVYALPSGVVNRTTGQLSHTEWGAAIRRELEKASNIELSATAAVNDSNIVVNVEVEELLHDNINANLLVWVVESGIVAMQINGNGDGKYATDYVHNHVLRASANGQHGDEFTLEKHEPQTAKYSIKIDEKWNTANLSVVVFVYNKEGVLQAAAAHL